jgi:hypothetical protein
LLYFCTAKEKKRVSLRVTRNNIENNKNIKLKKNREMNMIKELLKKLKRYYKRKRVRRIHQISINIDMGKR